MHRYSIECQLRNLDLFWCPSKVTIHWMITFWAVVFRGHVFLFVSTSFNLRVFEDHLNITFFTNTHILSMELLSLVFLIMNWILVFLNFHSSPMRWMHGLFLYDSPTSNPMMDCSLPIDIVGTVFWLPGMVPIWNIYHSFPAMRTSHGSALINCSYRHVAMLAVPYWQCVMT